MEEKEELELIEMVKQKVKQFRYEGSTCDEFSNYEAGIVVIGVQHSANGLGHDSIYLVTKEGLEEILSKTFRSGRMFPTGISEDGKTIYYTVKDESGEFHKREYHIF